MNPQEVRKAEAEEKARWKALTFMDKLREIFCFPKIDIYAERL